MYARGALRDPAIFARHLALCSRDASEETVFPEAETESQVHARIMRHAELARRLSPAHAALLKMRAAAPRYIRHLEGARRLRQGIIACRSWEEFDALLARFFSGERITSGPC